jgi:hypothetical protein
MGNAFFELLFSDLWPSADLFQRMSVLSRDAIDDLLSGAVHECEDGLLHCVLKSDFLAGLRHIRFEFLSSSGIAEFAEHFTSQLPAEADWIGAASTVKRISCAMDSVIISGGLPSIFDEFAHCGFDLLWRGSDHGFGPEVFHQRCDGHPNTLTIIRDTDGSVFGRFTPVKWESRVWNHGMWERNNCPKMDTTGRTFIFPIVNPHGIPLRRFRLRDGWER